MRRKKKPMIEYAPCKGGCGSMLASMCTSRTMKAEAVRFWCCNCITPEQRQEILKIQMAQKLLEASGV